MASTLDGIMVLDLTSGAAGALATMFLCDHGARVIRVVDRHHTALRQGGYRVWDRGKECVRLDFSRITLPEQNPWSHPTDGQTDSEDPAVSYARLIHSADVLVDDFAPASSHQALVRADWLSTLNPRLIPCSITAYGKQGPLKDEPPIDELVMARTGILGSQPGYRPAPVHVVHPLPSVGAAILANLGIAAALLARGKTGLGRQVQTSLMAGALLYHPKVTGDRLPPHSFQTHPAGSAPFYSVYECADGHWMQLGCVHSGFIAIAAKLMNLTEIIKQQRFGGGRLPETAEADRELRDRIATVMRSKSYEAWAQLFDEADVPFARARLTEESLDDPQVQFNQMVVELPDPEVGPLVQMGIPIQFSKTPGKIRGPRRPPSNACSRLPDEIPEGSPVSSVQQQIPASFDPPLKGIRILEITNLIAGPTGGRLLADLGADVIKVEPLGGDLSRPIGRTYFFNVNFNKRSVSVDTRMPEGKMIVQKIAATADALLANLRPHATERMGIGADINPRLIETHITGYGWQGPYAHRPGIDPLAQALMGMERAQGGAENPPVFPAQLAPTDYTTGALGAVGTILALLVRERTGLVQRVDCNLLSGGIVLSSEWFTRYQGKPERRLADKGQYGLDPFHRLYKVNDGWIYVVAETRNERLALCRALGSEDVLHHPTDPPPGHHPNDTPLAHELARHLANLSLEESLARLQASGIACAPAVAGDSNIFLDDPHTAANDMIATSQHPVVGQLRVARHYITFGNTDVVPVKPTPLLGEHTREVLQEIGFSEAAIAAFYEQGVVKTERPA